MTVKMDSKRIIKLASFIIVVLISIIVGLRFSPHLPQLNTQFTFPVLHEGDFVSQIEVSILSKNPDLFAGDSLLFKFRVFDILNSYYHSYLKDRKIGFIIEGTNPKDDRDIIPLKYLPAKNEYIGEGKVSFLFAGEHSLSLNYSYNDTISPRGRLVKAYRNFIYVLPYYEKHALGLNMIIANLTMIITILTGILLWHSFVLILPND